MAEALAVSGFEIDRVPGPVPPLHDQEPAPAVALAGPALPGAAAGAVALRQADARRRPEARPPMSEPIDRGRRRRLRHARLQRGGERRPRAGGDRPERPARRSACWSSTTSTRTTPSRSSARLQPRYPWVELVKNTIGRGVLNAVRAGIAATTAEVVIVTMADLSDDVAIVPRMVELIRDEGYDIVCASRYMQGGRQIGGPWLKRLLSRAAGVSLHWLAGLPTHDATNAFRAYRRERPGRDPDREPGRVRLLAGDHRQGVRARAGGSPRSPRPGATAPRASPGSGSGPGCRTTSTGISTP